MFIEYAGLLFIMAGFITFCTLVYYVGRALFDFFFWFFGVVKRFRTRKNEENEDDQYGI